MWVNLLGELVGHAEVGDSVEIKLLVEVLVVVACEGEVFAVVFVEHGSYSIESEPVGVVLFQPEADVGEQEPQNFIFGVIKDPTVPSPSASCRIARSLFSRYQFPHPKQAPTRFAKNAVL